TSPFCEPPDADCPRGGGHARLRRGPRSWPGGGPTPSWPRSTASATLRAGPAERDPMPAAVRPAKRVRTIGKALVRSPHVDGMENIDVEPLEQFASPLLKLLPLSAVSKKSRHGG